MSLANDGSSQYRQSRSAFVNLKGQHVALMWNFKFYPCMRFPPAADEAMAAIARRTSR